MIICLMRNVSVFLLSFALAFCVSIRECNSEEKTSARKILVKGAVITPMSISLGDMKGMHPFHINNVPLIEEKRSRDQKEKLIGVFSYQGVLLRDILERAGMQYKRKWEPLVFVQVRGSTGKEVVFSFGEIFYSSIGRSILIAYEKNGKPIEFSEACCELVVATDVRCGRQIHGVKEVIVERVNIKMNAYDDKKKNIVRPPTKEFLIIENKTENKHSVTPKDFEDLPMVFVDAAVMIGDCEGFKGVYSFEGPSLRSLLEKFGIERSKQMYNRYVAIPSEDGFSTTFSFGEIFNSRLGNNIIIAIKKNGELLGSKDGFAMSVVGEDIAGGRSVKRINKVEMF